MPAPIQQLNIYITARQLEDSVVKVIKGLATEQAYPLGDDLRRAASGAAHYVYQSHHYYSYEMKIEALHQARTETEKVQRLIELAGISDAKVTQQLSDTCLILVKQSWGLIKYFKTRQAEKAASSETRSKDELVAARA